MRNYLKDIEIVGATMVYQEGDQCRWSLNWLYKHCDRVCIVLDNYNEETEAVVMEYKKKYPKRTHVGYTGDTVLITKRTNAVQGQVKKRFKHHQAILRECVIKELKLMHDKKPIDLLIWPDSDETFIDEFPKFLEKFWHNSKYDYMMIGFIEPFDNLYTLQHQKMSPHGRVYRYKPEMTALPWRNRTRYNPYFSEKRPWKVRNLCVHMCHLTEAYRQRRKFFDNVNYKERCERVIWILPKDVRKMTAEEIADYQYGPRQAPSKYPNIPLEEYLNNKPKYQKRKLWTYHKKD